MEKNLLVTVSVTVVTNPQGVVLENPIFKVSVRVRRLLAKTYGATAPIELLAEKSVNDLYRIINLGRKGIMEITEALEPFGLVLKDPPSLF